MTKASTSKRRQKGGEEATVRKRILEAAFAAFMKSGYATTSTLEIATRARFEARALRARWQQTGNADHLHQRASQALRRAR
jgi:AcrR family transcriptional regulator